MKTIPVLMKNNNVAQALVLTEWVTEIQGEQYTFAVVSIEQHLNLTNVESGLRMAFFSDHLDLIAQYGTVQQRGKAILNEIISKYGEARLRPLLAGAKPIGEYENAQN